MSEHENPPLRILAYTHDAYGLGHLRRTLRLCDGLLARFPSATVLAATGSTAAHRFRIPNRVDYVKLPSITKVGRDRYVADGLAVHVEDVTAIRASVLEAMATRFAPDLVLVDRYPLGFGGEMGPALRALRGTRPQARIALGLRDILDDPLTVRQEWQRKGHTEAVTKFYDRVFVYGSRRLYDPIQEYAIPPSVAERMTFTGYLADYDVAGLDDSPRKEPGSGRTALCTVGGGKDASHIAWSFLEALQLLGPSWTGLLVTGPFLDAGEQQRLAAAAAPRGIAVQPFVDGLPSRMAAADVVVSMGGYNTMCEVLAVAAKAVIVPRTHPRREQLMRASLFSDSGIVGLVLPEHLTPESLADAMESRASIAREHIRDRVRAGFELDGVARTAAAVSALILGDLVVSP